jgi:hypothetical protein
LLPFLVLLALIVNALWIYFSLRSSAEHAWNQLESSYKRRGQLSKRPHDWHTIHHQNQIASVILVTIGFVAAIVWTIPILAR